MIVEGPSPLRGASRLLFWIAGLSLAFDLEAGLHYDPGFDRTYVEISAVVDLILLGLAAGARRGRSWALGLGTVTFLANAIAGYVVRESLIWLAWQLAVVVVLGRSFRRETRGRRATRLDGATGREARTPSPS